VYGAHPSPRRLQRLAALRGLYAIVDASSPQPPLELVQAFLAGGAKVLQLRLKNAGAGKLLELARAAVSLCRPAGAILLVNDRPDVAKLADADGVHLGQDDLPVAAARDLLGGDALIGLSTHSDKELDKGQLSGADYLGFGPVFATATKAKSDPHGAPLPAPHGLEGLARACKRSRLPLVAIGGITLETAPGVAAAGARCAAVIGWLAAGDPELRARQLGEAFARGRA
jgi:thiamine-phosphate pyrophosphorylase